MERQFPSSIHEDSCSAGNAINMEDGATVCELLTKVVGLLPS